MAPILPSLELRPLFSRRLMRSTSMRGGSIDERSIRERERESEENDSRNLVSVFTVASAPQFSRSSWKEGKVEAKPPRRNSICRDRKQLSTSVLFRSFLSLSFYFIPSFLPRYFHSDHQVYLSRRAYSTAKVTFKPNLSRLRAFFHSARMRRNNSPLTLANGKFDTARRMIAEFREGKCTLE